MKINENGFAYGTCDNGCFPICDFCQYYFDLNECSSFTDIDVLRDEKLDDEDIPMGWCILKDKKGDPLDDCEYFLCGTLERGKKSIPYRDTQESYEFVQKLVRERFANSWKEPPVFEQRNYPTNEEVCQERNNPEYLQRIKDASFNFDEIVRKALEEASNERTKRPWINPYKNF